MDSDDLHRTMTENQTHSNEVSSQNAEDSIPNIYITLTLCLSFVLLCIAIAFIALTVVRMWMRMKRTNDERERVTERNEPDDNFPARSQHTQPSRDQNDFAARRLRNTFENRGVAHQENFALEHEHDNVNAMQNYTTTTTTRTYPPVQCAPRPFPGVVDLTNDTEYKQKRSLPLMNTTYGSFCSNSSYEPVSVDDGFNNPLYDNPSNIAAPVGGATHDSHLSDHSWKNPEPVSNTHYDESVYLRPRNTPVPVSDTHYDESVYQRPRNTAVPVNDTHYDESVYQRPRNTPVPINDVTYDSVYEQFSTSLVLTKDDTSDSPVYDRPPRNPVAVESDIKESSQAAHPPRPSAYPVPSPRPSKGTIVTEKTGESY